jgi:murein DD-endopeptidase MepM/ murein hydrolase activator NlpD
MRTSLSVTPPRLFPITLDTGDLEFSCHVHLSGTADTTLPTTLTWHFRRGNEDTALLSGNAAARPDPAGDGWHAHIAALLPSGAAPGKLFVEWATASGVHRAAWPFASYAQPNSFALPFAGYALVLVGHRLGEVHRTAWQIPSQQFGWDLLPLGPDGWRLLRGEMRDRLVASDFAAFGRDVVAPAAARVVRAVDAFDDQTVVGVLPDPAPFLADLRTAAGNHLVLEHGQGIWSLLGHLRRGSLRVQVGEQVARGQPLATLGNSGYSSGPHLHLHFMDGPDPLRAAPLPIALDLDDGTFAPQAGAIVSSDAVTADA